MVVVARSNIMRAIRSKNTRPELYVRSFLHKAGFRFRIHVKHLPGNPDIVLPKFKAIIFVHGCFWHGHSCHLYNPAKRRSPAWEEKISKNRQRDRKAVDALNAGGWRVLEIWECAIQGKTRLPENHLSLLASDWINSSECHAEITGFEGRTESRSFI